MKTYILSTLFFFIVLSLHAQSLEQRDVDDFDRIIFEGRGDLILTAGSQPALELETKEATDLNRIRTYVQGKTLHIEYERDHDDVWDMYPKITVYVSYLDLQEVNVAGIVDVSTELPIERHDFRFKAEGMGKSYLEVDVDRIDVEIAGTADVELIGSAKRGNLLLDGTGKLDAFALQAERIDAEVNGTGTLFVYATESLHVDANGFGALVKYKGNPEEKIINKSGWVSVKQVSSR